MLAEQARVRRGGDVAHDAPPVVDGLAVVVVAVAGHDEARAAGDHLVEVGGALPASSEAPEAVCAAEVGHGGQAVGDGRSMRRLD